MFNLINLIKNAWKFKSMYYYLLVIVITNIIIIELGSVSMSRHSWQGSHIHT